MTLSVSQKHHVISPPLALRIGYGIRSLIQSVRGWPVYGTPNTVDRTHCCMAQLSAVHVPWHVRVRFVLSVAYLQICRLYGYAHAFSRTRILCTRLANTCATRVRPRLLSSALGCIPHIMWRSQRPRGGVTRHFSRASSRPSRPAAPLQPSLSERP